MNKTAKKSPNKKLQPTARSTRNGKSKKETRTCPKMRKEEGKGRKAEEIHVGLHEWQAG
jgi:hypothetical protein